MAWYIDENNKVYRYTVHSPTAIRLDDGRVIEGPTSVWAVDPEKNPLLKKVDGKWICRREDA